jgi:hypothetical protein
LVEQRIENPRVGGSIPPQATRIHPPQRPFRVLGRFYISGAASTIRRSFSSALTEESVAILIWDCPRCGAGKVTFDVPEVNEREMKFGWQRHFEAFSVCRGCKRATVFRLSQTDVKWKLLLATNKVTTISTLNDVFDVTGFVSIKDNVAEKAPEHVPEGIAAVFNEGAVCMAVKCFNAAGTMFRLCLDLATRALMPDENVDGLNSKIRFSLGLRLHWLFETERLPNGLRDLSSCVKEDGNDGAHEGTLSEADAYDLHDFTVALLERLYTEPKRLELARSRRDARRAPSA